MNANEFWNMLSENSKKKVEKILNGYAGSEGIIGRIFEMYEEGAVLSDCTIEDYLEVINPDEYVDYCYEKYIERYSFYRDINTILNNWR